MAFVDADAERVLREELEALVERVRANIESSGKRVTGRTGDSMAVSVTAEDEGVVVGAVDAVGYFAVLETGSRPWTNVHTRTRKDGSEYPSAPKWFIDIIRQWISDKGLAIDNPWGVATKIMTEGSKLFREGGRTDIYSRELETAAENVSRRLCGLFDAEVTRTLARG